MKYNQCEPGESILKFMFISLLAIALCTLIIIGLIFLVTMDGILTALITPWVALAVTIAWAIHTIRIFYRERKLQ